MNSIIYIPTIDLLLCLFFGTKARWFQLHSVINGIIVYYIKDDVYNLLLYPDKITTLNNPQELYYICFLHLYHFLFFKNSKMDYFHHFVFVLCGVLPVYYFYNKNLIRLATLSGCGIPGIIEYFTLVLVKHDKMYSLQQKRLMTYVYNYFRCPFGIFACSIIYYNHILNKTPDISEPIISFVIIIIFLNSAFFNQLTLKNSIESYYKNKKLLCE